MWFLWSARFSKTFSCCVDVPEYIAIYLLFFYMKLIASDFFGLPDFPRLSDAVSTYLSILRCIVFSSPWNFYNFSNLLGWIRLFPLQLHFLHCLEISFKFIGWMLCSFTELDCNILKGLSSQFLKNQLNTHNILIFLFIYMIFNNNI